MHPSLNFQRAAHHMHGVGLIEVLVALVITTVGMLGIASMYVTTMSAKTTALSRTRAVNLAYDMADRIRANPTGAASYAIAWGAATPAVNCATVNCDQTQIAATDLNQWKTLLTTPSTGLLQGDGNITYTVSTGPNVPDIYTIQIRWQEKGFGMLQLDYPVQICNRDQTPDCKP